MKLILSTIIILISISQILHSSELICQKEKNFSNYGYYSHPKLIEINPRMSGSIAESYKKNIFLIDDLIDLIL